MTPQLEFNDTFSEWRTKINDLISKVNTDTNDFSEVVDRFSSFSYDTEASSGLTVFVKGGNVRSKSNIDAVAAKSFTLVGNKTMVVAIHKEGAGIGATLRAYKLEDLPNTSVIPVGVFVTNSTNVVTYIDMRTEFSIEGIVEPTVNFGSVLQFDKIINVDLLIPSNKNAISVSPTINTGVLVSVSEGSDWVVL